VYVIIDVVYAAINNVYPLIDNVDGPINEDVYLVPAYVVERRRTAIEE